MAARTQAFLGRAIERMIEAHPPRAPLRFTLSVWERPDLDMAASQRCFPGGGSGGRRIPELPQAPYRQRRWREMWWISPPDLVRIDFHWPTPRHGHWIIRGSEGFTWNDGELARTAPEQQSPDHGCLVDPAQRLLRFQLGLVGTGTVDGRHCTRLRARPHGWRAATDAWGTGLPLGANEHLLWVDDETGIVTRCESRVDGVVIRRATARSLLVGEEPPPSLFVPPELDRAPEGPTPFPRDEELVTRVGFTVFDQKAYGDWYLDETSRGGPFVEHSVDVGGQHVRLRQRAARRRLALPPIATTKVVRDGLVFHVLEAGTAPEIRRGIMFQRDGTEIHLGPSSATAEELIAVALTLRPVTGARPELLDA